MDDKEYVGWDINKTLRGVAFRDDLARLINKKGVKTTSYNSMISVGAKAAAYKNTGKFIPFYHGEECLATQNQCNREHTWPNSRGGGNVEDDPFVIRPTLSSENSDRSNYFYGLNGKASLEWDPASCGFTPARGEAARVIFYIACRYGKTYKLYLTNNPSDDWTKVKTMGRLDRMYEWNQMYPPTENEIQINNYLESQGYGRNPFVDYPEFAERIWDPYWSVDEQEYVVLVNVWPNPATSTVNIAGENLDAVYMYNAMGQLILSLDVSNDEQSAIDVSGFNGGIYFLNVISNNGNSTLKKVVVQ